MVVEADTVAPSRVPPARETLLVPVGAERLAVFSVPPDRTRVAPFDSVTFCTVSVAVAWVTVTVVLMTTSSPLVGTWPRPQFPGTDHRPDPPTQMLSTGLTRSSSWWRVQRANRAGALPRWVRVVARNWPARVRTVMTWLSRGTGWNPSLTDESRAEFNGGGGDGRLGRCESGVSYS